MADQDDLYKEACVWHGPTLRRLVRGYEADPELRRDLLQDIHIELWRSLRRFDGRCSLQTWVYRVAHNVGASHITQRRRTTGRLVNIDELQANIPFVDGEAQANQQYLLSRLFDRIYSLKPLDRQIFLLYLEGETAATISEITGVSTSNIATKLHRLRKLISRASGEGVTHDNR